MKQQRFGDLSERLGSAAAARKAQLEHFRSRPAEDDPEVARKRAARQQIVEAREQRARERDEARRQLEELRAAEEARLEAERQAERVAREAAEEAERIAREKDRPMQAIRDAALYASRKAATSRR